MQDSYGKMLVYDATKAPVKVQAMANRLVSCDKLDLVIWLAWFMCSKSALAEIPEAKALIEIIEAQL